MLIKTITCHDVYNYGATLQAYALMKYLQNNGHEVEIINYKPDYLSRYNLWLIGDRFKERNILVKLLYLLLKFPKRLMKRKATIPFEVFKRKYMCITRKRYTSYDELKKDPHYAKCSIEASGQLYEVSDKLKYFFENRSL